MNRHPKFKWIYTKERNYYLKVKVKNSNNYIDYIPNKQKKNKFIFFSVR
jgi:hypothetical protein